MKRDWGEEGEGRQQKKEARKKRRVKEAEGNKKEENLSLFSAPRLWSVSQSVSTVLWPLKGRHDSRTELKHSHSEPLLIHLYLPSTYCKCKDSVARDGCGKQVSRFKWKDCLCIFQWGTPLILNVRANLTFKGSCLMSSVAHKNA